MAKNILTQVADLMTPSRWSRNMRRLFVLLCPISVPTLVLLWITYIAVMFGVFVLGMSFCIAVEVINALIVLWRK